MSKYVLAFRGQPDRLPEEEERAWGAWFEQIGPAIADRVTGWAQAVPCPPRAAGWGVRAARRRLIPRCRTGAGPGG
jgi:hypothetical protein